ncbi:MAG TPA: GNAT family N-acetyltransferase [Hyphomonadaceae bacterium]|nr:GNAT family N-acetyltransferase [Hyphomonadaceae bacterium]
MQFKIQTQRLALRRYEGADAARVAYLAGDYDVARMCGRVPHPYPIAAAYSFFDMLARSEASGAEHAFAVTLPIDGVIGACGLSRIGEAGSETWELGYWYGMPYWGLGYASEAARALMEWGRDQLGAKVFVAGHFADNPASGNVLRKLGFVETGTEDLFGLARQRTSPATRYVWPEGATPVTLSAHPSHAH